jgi:hypothetical protein
MIYNNHAVAEHMNNHAVAEHMKCNASTHNTENINKWKVCC